MNKDTRKVCFVVMGFGKKTDFESGRTLDLDAAYEAIIHPAASAQGFRCIRADEIIHSGSIDTEMYDMLLRADLVIADISTGNVNAVYELGVRHALRPNSTIIMKEADGRLYFDLNHVATFHYKHLGSDIGAREAERATAALGTLIAQVMLANKPDSPVYTYLPALQQPRLSEAQYAALRAPGVGELATHYDAVQAPRLSDAQYAALLDTTESGQNKLAMLMHRGEQAMRESRHEDAEREFGEAAILKPGDATIIQQLALAAYKTEAPSKFDALIRGLHTIHQLDPDASNDPQTLGIAGAIRKRLWLFTQNPAQLDLAIRHYKRGFEIRRDYYNGENLAACYDYRAAIQAEPAEAAFDRMSARKVRIEIIEILGKVVDSPSFAERSDRRWVFATLANCSFALDRPADGEKYEAAFLSEDPAKWEIETYSGGKRAA
ncbi:MAG: tetratricopeptide repeat-containing protein [Pseudomonadota bacterium]